MTPTTSVQNLKHADGYNSICGPAPYGGPLSMVSALSILTPCASFSVCKSGCGFAISILPRQT